jgi:hypothetical protein
MATEKPKRGRGRPQSHDWDDLFKRWAVSGLSKSEFLQRNNINVRYGSVMRNTRTWYPRLEEIRSKTLQTVGAYHAQEHVREVVDAKPEADREAVAKELGIDLSEIKTEAQPSTWQVIAKWRSRQAIDDWRLADQIRTQIRIILKNAVKRKVSIDDAGNQVTDYSTSLSPHELRALTTAVESIQRVQRLALGLSTDNVGVNFPMPVDSDDKGKEKPEDRVIPIFQVRMNRAGRFEASRPRQVR